MTCRCISGIQSPLFKVCPFASSHAPNRGFNRTGLFLFFFSSTKTCKQIAPRLKRKEWAAADRVIGEFDRIKKMQYGRVSRAGPDKKPSIIDLSPPEYWAWLSKATDALASYLFGELSEEDALKIIHVPTIQELREENSAELTAENTPL